MMEEKSRTTVENKLASKVVGDGLGTLVGVPIASKKRSDPKLQLL